MNHEILSQEQIEEITEQLRYLRYDSLCSVLKQLSVKITADAKKDNERNRTQLSKELQQIATYLGLAVFHCGNAWNICEPHMKKVDKKQ